MNNGQINIPIIPVDQIFYSTSTRELIQWKDTRDLEIDYQAIAIFCALGFMLDDDTYYKDIKTCKPSTKYDINNNIIKKVKKNWQWNYTPREITFLEIQDEFSSLLEKLVENKIENKRILLPISGGIDSRTLFASVKNRSELTLSSYEFQDGFSESETGRRLSEHFNIPFYSQKIQKGYLWNKLDKLHQSNHCFTDFTHPRQIDAIGQWKGLGDVILLGHWGDVLFDKQTDSDDISYEEQLIQLKRKFFKPGGVELADNLWKYWGLEGSFDSYITDRLDRLYCKIKIDHTSARLRAFKSLYWAPRWTSINLSIFSQAGEMVIPFYSDEMCKFICTVPERHLEGRKIQLEYIKKHCPEAAQIPWQKYYPLNIYQYQWFNHPVYYPVRTMRKVKRLLQEYLFKSHDLVTRNWELQFLGENNLLQLKNNLMKRSKYNKLIPKKIIRDYLEKFEVDPVKYAHPVSMLLTLAIFSDRVNQE